MCLWPCNKEAFNQSEDALVKRALIPIIQKLHRKGLNQLDESQGVLVKRALITIIQKLHREGLNQLDQSEDALVRKCNVSKKGKISWFHHRLGWVS